MSSGTTAGHRVWQCSFQCVSPNASPIAGLLLGRGTTHSQIHSTPSPYLQKRRTKIQKKGLQLEGKINYPPTTVTVVSNMDISPFPIAQRQTSTSILSPSRLFFVQSKLQVLPRGVGTRHNDTKHISKSKAFSTTRSQISPHFSSSPREPFHHKVLHIFFSLPLLPCRSTAGLERSGPV